MLNLALFAGVSDLLRRHLAQVERHAAPAATAGRHAGGRGWALAENGEQGVGVGHKLGLGVALQPWQQFGRQFLIRGHLEPRAIQPLASQIALKGL